MSCYNCKNAEIFRNPREYDGFQVHGVCLKEMGRNGHYSVYPIYIPGGSCKDMKASKRDSRQMRIDLLEEGEAQP